MTTHSPLDPLPPRLEVLPKDPRGYPVPWFVAEVPGIDGRPPTYDFRVMDPEKFVQAVKHRRCWICGQPLGRWLVFSIGPMCTITRTISEPPGHLECAHWSVKNCPFLVNPKFTRNVEGLPANVDEPAGIGLMRNPGVMCLWITRSYEVFKPPHRAKGQTPLPLITIGDAQSVEWWREGRPATRAEVEASISGGIPTLLAAAKADGPFAVEMMGKQYEAAAALWPQE